MLLDRGRGQRLVAALVVSMGLLSVAPVTPVGAVVYDGPCNFAVYQIGLFNGDPRISIYVQLQCLPQQHTQVQVKLIEDDGAHRYDDLLMSTDWKKRNVVGSQVEYRFRFNGNCDTEIGDEEMLAKVRVRYRADNSQPWHVTAWDLHDFIATDYYC